MYSTRITSLIIIACWFLWGFYWIINIRNSKIIVFHQSAQNRTTYVLLLAADFILVLSDTSRWPLIGHRLVRYTPSTAAVAALIVVAGLAITLWARRVLADNWSADVALKKDHELITKGPYSLVRHPIYTGLLGLTIGTAIAQGTYGAFLGLACGIASCLIKLEQEEQLMLSHFGKNYKNYQARTKRLIPFLF